MSTMTRPTLLAVTAVCWFAAMLQAGPAEGIRQEQRRIEDIRILHYFSITSLHEARALAGYLEDWGGPQRDPEVESLMLEAESLYGWLRAIDNGSLGLQAVADVHGVTASDSEHLQLLARTRGQVAGRIAEFHQRCSMLRAALQQAVSAAAPDLGYTVRHAELPWPQPARETGRQAGLRFGALLEDRILDQPEANWDEYLSRFRRAGLSFANVYWLPAGDWAQLEPQPGDYDFTAVDRVLAACTRQQLRIGLKLATISGAPPAWHVAAEPASRFAVAPRPGQAPQPQGINLMHAPTRERFTAFAAALAAHLRTRWAPQVEAIYVEGGQHELGDVEDAAGAELSAAEREARLQAYIETVTAALRQGWPEVAVEGHTMSHDFHRLFALRSAPGRDLAQLAGFGAYPTTQTDSPASYALLRSFAGGRWLWHEAIHTGCGTIGAASLSLASLNDVSRIVIGRGHNMIRATFPQNWFRYPDFQYGDSGIGAYYMAAHRAAAWGATVMQTAPAPAEVAILWSQTSRRQEPETMHYRAALAFGHLLSRIFVPVDYVDERRLADRLPHYRLLILPSCQWLTADQGRVIRDWVAGGGHLWGFGAPGLYDETGAAATETALPETFGARIERLRVPAAITPDRLVTSHPEGSYQTQNTPPRPYQFEAQVYAALTPVTATARAWFAGAAHEVAVTTQTFGTGSAMLCGLPLGYEYWQAAPYECALGVTHNRLTNYNEEQKRYEQWVGAELQRIGIRPPARIIEGRMLRSQRGDDPDWFHVYRNGPGYRDYFYETDKPVRTVYAAPRLRDGVDDLYLGLAQTEGNYMWERGYFRSTLAGCWLQVAARMPTDGHGSVYDLALGVPVPARKYGADELVFRTWSPMAAGAMFAVPAGRELTLFNGPAFSGEPAAAIAARVAAYVDEVAPEPVQIVAGAAIADFLAARRGQALRVGIGDLADRAAFELLAEWLRADYDITATETMAGPRLSNRYAYMDGFGYPDPGPEPVAADIVIGNCQDNCLMRRFITAQKDCYWLPIEVNRDYPGPGRALVMLSLPVVSQADGKPGGKVATPQLVIGASFPDGALSAVRELGDYLQQLEP